MMLISLRESQVFQSMLMAGASFRFLLISHEYTVDNDNVNVMMMKIIIMKIILMKMIMIRMIMMRMIMMKMIMMKMIIMKMVMMR